MSAGTGIRHSEYNHEDSPTRIFQIWIMPTRSGEAPGWGARPFPRGERAGQFVTLASGYAEDREGGGDALPIRTDARVIAATLKAGESASYPLGRDRKAYLVPATGAVKIEDVMVQARDGAAIRDLDVLTVTALEDSEIVMVDAA
jgi:redox-sensitive bicupin YhaK (pirin superfamily)